MREGGAWWGCWWKIRKEGIKGSTETQKGRYYGSTETQKGRY